MTRPCRRRLRGRVHAVGWFGPVTASVTTLLIWSGVAHSSGSGWVQAVGATLAAVLVTGLVAPFFPARRAAVTCVACPSDTTAGSPTGLTMVASGPIRIRPLRPTGPETTAAGVARGRRAVSVSVAPDRRGVIESVTVEVASSAPFGLLWWAREMVVPLPRPLHVAPRLGDGEHADLRATDEPGDALTRVPASLGEPRGVRAYRAGDMRRSVHWPATAHAGILMVRETERPTDLPVVIEATLPAEPDAAERAAERVMSLVTDHLVTGTSVILVTREAAGRTVQAPVRDRIELGRRLARAVAPVAGEQSMPATRP